MPESGPERAMRGALDTLGTAYTAGQAHDAWQARLAPPNADGCRLWRGPRDRRGYGVWYAYGTTLYIHRLAYQFAYGPVPRRTRLRPCPHARHCATPSHLTIVTRW